MAAKRGLNLGKGLDSLISQNSSVSKSTANNKRNSTGQNNKNSEENVSRALEKEQGNKSASNGEPVYLKITEVFPNKAQARTEFDEESLNDLAESIKHYGVIQPLLVQKKGKNYEIIAGERRWRAAKLAKLKTVPVIIKELSEQEVVEISLIENIQREDLNAIEEANAFRRLMTEFDLTQEEIAKSVSRSRSAITNSLRLLNLDERVQQMLVDADLSAGHARALLGLEDEDLQFTAAEEIVASGLNVRETEMMVKKLLSPKPESKKKVVDEQMEAVFKELERKLTDSTGTKVSIRRGRGKRGKIEIEYYSQDDLDRIINMLNSNI